MICCFIINTPGHVVGVLVLVFGWRSQQRVNRGPREDWWRAGHRMGAPLVTNVCRMFSYSPIFTTLVLPWHGCISLPVSSAPWRCVCALCVLLGPAVLLFLLGIKNTLKHDFATAARRRPHSGTSHYNGPFTWHFYVREMIDYSKNNQCQNAEEKYGVHYILH